MNSPCDAKRRILDEALASFLEAVGEEQFRTFPLSPSDFLHVPLAIWMQLINRGLLEEVDMNYEMYRLTPLGYVTARKASGHSGPS